MTYEMYMVHPPSGRIKGYTPQHRLLPGVYSFSNRGMDVMLDVMRSAGATDETAPVITMPPWPPKGISQTRIDALAAEFVVNGESGHVCWDYSTIPTAREEHLIEQWAHAANSILTSRSGFPNKVPEYKFLSQHAWLVWPEECLVIADTLDHGLASMPDKLIPDPGSWGMTTTSARRWVKSWSGFSRVAASNGGYRIG